MSEGYLKAAGGNGSRAFKAGLRLLDEAAMNVAEAGRLFAGIAADEWDLFVAEAPGPMRRTLGYVRAVGEGRMIPELATAAGESAQRLRALPLADQSRLWVEPVEMHAPGRIGRHAKYMRYVTEMDSAEVRRAFGRDGRGWRLRSYDEQRAWEAEQAAKKADPAPHGVDRPGRWAVRNGRVFIAAAKASAGLSKKDVAQILRDMEEEA